MMSTRTMKLALIVWAMVAIATAETNVVRLENIERKMFQLVNQERTERGLATLKWNDKLSASASFHLDKMIARKSLAHRFAGEPALTERIAATGLRFNASAENVAYATDWEDLHPGLMKSPGHRANILSPKYDEVGIAVALGANGYYAVQNFAHTTSESTGPEAEARFAKAMRKELGRSLEVRFNPRIRQAMCEMAERDRVEARRLPAEPERRRMFAFTAAEPDDLPRSLLDAVSANNVKSIEVGVCYKVTEKYPGGTYWIGVLY